MSFRYINPYRLPQNIPSGRRLPTAREAYEQITRQQEANSAINIAIQERLGQFNPLQELTNLVQSPKTWFNVIGVIIALLALVIALNVIVRKGV